MEKDQESIATVQMKPEYAASEVYSTASEPPPAYKMRPSNAVQIAKIISVAVIVSSLIIGCFILASSYIQAKTTCDQMQALDAVLGKELMLETLQDLPKPEALLQTQGGEENINNNLPEEKLSTEKSIPLNEEPETTESSNEEMEKKMPLEMILGELAGALLGENQRSKLNCVIERRTTEESVDAPARNVQLPFGMNLSSDPKKQKVSGERMAIFCDTGADEKFREPAEAPRLMPIHFNAIPIPNNRPQFPMTHMAQQMPPHQQQNLVFRQQFNNMNDGRNFRQIPLPLQPLLRQLQPSQFMNAPSQEQPEVRIQLHRIAIPSPISTETREEPQEMPQMQIQRVPFNVALQQAGITADDLKNIQRMAEERIQQELRDLANDDSSEEDDTTSEEDSRQQSLPYGRFAFGRSLVNPVKIPVSMQTQETDNEQSTQPAAEYERPHYVQPRSVPE